MARGSNAPIGATRTAPNGYHYTKVEDAGDGKPGWRLTHHLVAEEKLGRKIEADERVSFHNGKRSDMRPSNIRVAKKGSTSIHRRKAQIEARIAELQAELDDINKKLMIS